MKKLKKKVRKKIMKLFAGKARLQPFFEALHEFSLSGLNYGGGDNVSNSGEKNVIGYLTRHIGPTAHPIVFDVGANDGSYAQEVIAALGDRAQIFCFEPSKSAFTALSGVMGGRPNVELCNFGCGEVDGTVSIYADAEGSRLGSMFPGRVEHLGINSPHKEEIRVRRLDDFCRERKIGHIDLLKVDVEGGELGVLKGAESLVRSRSIRIIQFEFGACDIASRTFFRDFFILLNPNYRIFRILKDGFAPVDEYKDSREVFMTTNYMAVSRNI